MIKTETVSSLTPGSYRYVETSNGGLLQWLPAAVVTVIDIKDGTDIAIKNFY